LICLSVGGRQLVRKSTHSLELFRVRFRIRAGLRVRICVRARVTLALGTS